MLAPMADVTDMAFRQIVVSCGKPDVLYTEFVSCDGLCSKQGRSKLLPHLKFKSNERPIVAQFFGSKPENFYKCAQLAAELGFDGIDINMGCPAGKVVKQDSGAGLILNPGLAQKIISEIKRGACSTSSGQALPVSVKTRIGYNKIGTKEWITKLLEMEPAAIIIHGRTRKEMSKVPAHWDEIGLAKELAKDTKTLIIGNGDVVNLDDAKQKAKDYNLDGIMVGRGIFANPWFFNEKIDIKEIKPEQRIKLMLKHLDNFLELWGEGKNFDTMKKFFKVYVSGWPDAKELRAKLMIAKDKSAIVDILSKRL